MFPKCLIETGVGRLAGRNSSGRTPIHILAFAVFGILLGGTGCETQKPKEPAYQGRRITDWLGEYESADSEKPWRPDAPWESKTKAAQDKAEAALSNMGTNAVPFLLHMLMANDYGDWLRAVLGFHVLGEGAKPAVPVLAGELEAQRKRSDRKRDPWPVCVALGAIGPPAADAVPALLQWSSPSNGPVATFAVSALGNIHGRPGLVVPTLVSDLASWGTNNTVMIQTYLVALGNFGVEAKPAVPGILPFLNSWDKSLRPYATNALMQIDPGSVTKP